MSFAALGELMDGLVSGQDPGGKARGIIRERIRSGVASRNVREEGRAVVDAFRAAWPGEEPPDRATLEYCIGVERLG